MVQVKWEYRRDVRVLQYTISDLNTLGSDGWEVVSEIKEGHPVIVTKFDSFTYLFKRLRSE